MAAATAGPVEAVPAAAVEQPKRRVGGGQEAQLDGNFHLFNDDEQVQTTSGQTVSFLHRNAHWMHRHNCCCLNVTLQNAFVATSRYSLPLHE